MNPHSQPKQGTHPQAHSFFSLPTWLSRLPRNIWLGGCGRAAHWVSPPSAAAQVSAPPHANPPRVLHAPSRGMQGLGGGGRGLGGRGDGGGGEGGGGEGGGGLGLGGGGEGGGGL